MKNKFIRFCAIPLVTFMLCTTAISAAHSAGEDQNLTLQDAVDKGVHTSPEYTSVANNKLATREELAQAKDLWLPSVDFIGETGWERTHSPSVPTTDNTNNLFHNRASITLTQLLFDGFGTDSEITRQKYRVESASNRVGEVSEFVGLDIVEAYLEVMRQRDLLTIARANVDDHNRILDTIQTGANAGTITDGDVAQAKARIAQARSTVTSTEEALREAESKFIQKTGEMPGTMAFPEVPREKLQANVDDAVRVAITNSPTLAVYESDIKVAKAEFDGSGSTLYPHIDLEFNASEGDDLSGIEGNDNSESALAVMKWNLYRGGADNDRQREFMYRHAQSKEARATASRQVEKDMRDTWSGMLSAAERAQEFQDQATSNEKVVGVYLDQFSLDRRTLLDVLDSQNELFVSRSNHVNALYTEMFAVYRVLALQGNLLNTLGVAKPREAFNTLPQ